MKFDEKKALEIIQRHNLSKTTLKVWRTRGSIPDAYLDENYQRSQAITPAQAAIAKRVLAVNAIAWTVALPRYQSFIAFQSGKEQLHTDDFEGLVQACESIRKILLAFAAAPSARTWKAIYEDPRIHAYMIFSKTLVDRARKNIMVSPNELAGQVNEAKLLASKIKIQ